MMKHDCPYCQCITKLPCPCCQYKTMMTRGGYEMCPICFWEDDATRHPDDHSFANDMTLHEARLNFESFGVVDPKYIRAARDPTPEDL